MLIFTKINFIFGLDKPWDRFIPALCVCIQVGLFVQVTTAKEMYIICYLLSVCAVISTG